MSEEPRDGDGETEAESDESGVDMNTVLTYLTWGGVVALGILSIVAGIGLYTSLSAVIDVWITDRFQPFARIGLNFAVLCVALAGIVALARRL